MTDLIDRQAAIDLFPNDALEWDTKGAYIAPHLARRMIEELPTAQPHRMRGRWIYGSPVTMKCDRCGYYIADWRQKESNYCPNCGADMREGEG